MLEYNETSGVTHFLKFSFQGLGDAIPGKRHSGAATEQPVPNLKVQKTTILNLDLQTIFKFALILGCNAQLHLPHHPPPSSTPPIEPHRQVSFYSTTLVHQIQFSTNLTFPLINYRLEY